MCRACLHLTPERGVEANAAAPFSVPFCIGDCGSTISGIDSPAGGSVNRGGAVMVTGASSRAARWEHMGPVRRAVSDAFLFAAAAAAPYPASARPIRDRHGRGWGHAGAPLPVLTRSRRAAAADALRRRDRADGGDAGGSHQGRAVAVALCPAHGRRPTILDRGRWLSLDSCGRARGAPKIPRLRPGLVLRFQASMHV